MPQDTHWQLIEKVLSHTATAQEQQAFQRWLQQDARHQQTFEEIQQAWHRSPRRFDPFSAYAKLQSSLTPKRSRQRVARLYSKAAKVAASLVLVLLASWLVYHYQAEITNVLYPVTYRTVLVPSGSRQQVQLSDGTKIFLNAGSQLRYPTRFNQAQRQVFLEGEGYFEVASDTTKPFIIESGALTTQVLGTRFNLKAYPGDSTSKVTVVSGRVQVSHPATSQHTVLQPGQQAIYAAHQYTLTKTTVPNARASKAWTNGILIFNDTPLPEVIQALNRKYNVHIRVANDKLRHCRIFGTFKQTSLEATLEIVCKSLNASCRYQGRVIIIDGNGCER